MIAHSEYCSSGDSTVEALQCAIYNVTKEEADDYFVFGVSDANLARYGIRPQQLSDALLKVKFKVRFSEKKFMLIYEKVLILLCRILK
jgi:hypothetical protein